MAVKKIYYSMGEVSEMFDVRPSLLRHWESQFTCLKPHKNQKGNRMFTEADIEKLKQIYHLVKERGMTLKGAAQVMRRSSQNELARETQLLERLQRIRAELLEVREELKGDGKAEVVVSNSVDEAVEEQCEVLDAEQVAESSAESSVEESVAEPEPERKRKNVVQKISDSEEEAQSEQPKKRTVRRKKKDEEKELFPFYEQSLF